MPSLPRSLRRVVVAASILSPVSLLALSPPNRIASVDGSARATVAHNVSGRAKHATDLGPAPSDRRLDGVTLFFSRTAAQQAALDQLLKDQRNPASANFHKWLTPTQFGAQFGLSSSDLAKVSSWLTSQGLSITYTAPSNSLITVSGTVAQLQQAFGTSIHLVLSSGEQHIANLTDPVLPAAIANIVTGVTGLNDFRLKSHARPQSAVSPAVTPAFTSAQGTHNHYLAPGDFQTIYDSKPLLASAINGSGATIAVVGQTTLSLPDVASFRSAAGLPAQTPSVVIASASAPTSNGSDIQESQLDVEWAGASAPNAQILFVTSANGVFNALQYAITQHLASIISISYGNCEPAFAASDVASFNSLFQQGNALGETILASSGDSGATDCDGGSITAADGLAVDFPASSPSVTGVGGTMFNDTDANWQATTGTTDQVVSALGYIPETVWNEYSTFGALASGGGGASVYFPKPDWQVGSGVPNDLSRDVPDISLNAGANHVGYLYCVPVLPGITTIDSCTSGFRDATGGLTVVGGTSAGTPSFAGVLALVQQKIGSLSGLGNINPVLYALGSTSAFHDITTGSNTSPCVHGSPDCQTASSIGNSASTGYDLASGWGSIDANVLANAWKSAVPTGGTSTTGTATSFVTLDLPSGAQSCAISNGSLTVSVQVAALATGAGVPTGSVQLLVDGAAVGTPVTLTNGAATLLVNTSSLSSGGHSVGALYTGDSVYASSKSYLGPDLFPTTLAPATVVDVVSSTSPDFSLTPCLPNVSVLSGGTSTPITLTATAFNGFTGPVTFTVSTDSSLAANFAFSASPVTLSSTTAGTTSLTFSAFTTNSSSVSASGMKRVPSAGSASISRRGLAETGAGTAALASVLFLVLPRRRRYLGLVAVVLSVGVFGLSGCGSGAKPIDSGGVVVTTTPTPVGAYTVNVTASGTNSTGQALVHTVVLTLTVTQ